MSSTHHSRAGRIGGLRLHATRSSHAIAANARAGLERRFRNDVIEQAAATGQGLLSEGEIDRRTALHRRIYYLELADKARKARTAKRAA